MSYSDTFIFLLLFPLSQSLLLVSSYISLTHKGTALFVPILMGFLQKIVYYVHKEFNISFFLSCSPQFFLFVAISVIAVIRGIINCM